MLSAINYFLAITFRSNMEYVLHLRFRVTKQSQTKQGSEVSGLSRLHTAGVLLPQEVL